MQTVQGEGITPRNMTPIFSGEVENGFSNMPNVP